MIDLPEGSLRAGGLKSVVITDEGRFITAGERDVLAAAVSGAQREAKVSLTNNTFDVKPVGATFFTAHPKVKIGQMQPKAIRIGSSHSKLQAAAREVVRVVSSGVLGVFPVLEAVRPEHSRQAQPARLPVASRA